MSYLIPSLKKAVEVLFNSEFVGDKCISLKVKTMP